MCRFLINMAENSLKYKSKMLAGFTGWVFDGDRTTGPGGAQSQATRSTGGSRQDRTGQWQMTGQVSDREQTRQDRSVTGSRQDRTGQWHVADKTGHVSDREQSRLDRTTSNTETGYARYGQKRIGGTKNGPRGALEGVNKIRQVINKTQTGNDSSLTESHDSAYQWQAADGKWQVTDRETGQKGSVTGSR